MKSIKLTFLIFIAVLLNNSVMAQVDSTKLHVKFYNEDLSLVGDDVLMTKVAIYDSTMTQTALKEAITSWSQEAFSNRTSNNDVSSESQVFINYITDFGTGFGSAKVNALLKIYIRQGKIKVEVYYTSFLQNGNTVKYVAFKKDGTIRNSKKKIMLAEKEDVDNLINTLIDYLYSKGNNDDF